MHKIFENGAVVHAVASSQVQLYPIIPAQNGIVFASQEVIIIVLP